MKAAGRPANPVNVALTGVFFGVLQWCAFFLLQANLAATALVWLLATSVWLLGSIAGLVAPTDRWREPWWILASILAYHGLFTIVRAHAYELGYLPLALACVAVMGAYAGCFFRLRAARGLAAGGLFFIENTGFVVGTLVTVGALFWFGNAPLALAPGLAGCACLLTLPQGTER